MDSLVSPWSKLPVPGIPGRFASGEVIASGKKRLSIGVEDEMNSWQRASSADQQSPTERL